MEKSPGLPDRFSCRRKACKNMIAFARKKPLPKLCQAVSFCLEGGRGVVGRKQA
ncbi:hypothetical protein ES706_06677 [subsurface metagenome]